MLITVGTEDLCNLSSSCVLSVRRRWQGCGKICSGLSVTGQGSRKKGDSFETSQADDFAAAKALIEVSGIPALVSTTGLLFCTFK